MPIVYYIWYTNICITTTGGIFNLLLLFHVYPRLIRGCCGLAAKRDSRGRPGGRRQDPGEISLGQLPAGRRGAAHGAQGAAGRILAAAAVYRVYVHCLSTPRVQIIKVNSSRPPRRRAWRPGWPGPPAGSWRVPGQLPAGRRGAARGAQGAAGRILAGSSLIRIRRVQTYQEPFQKRSWCICEPFFLCLSSESAVFTSY